MKRLVVCMALAGMLAGCESQFDAKRTPEQLAAINATWSDKKWSGTWGDPCTGSIEVFEVTGTTATVEYSWGKCGGDNIPGSTIVKDARVSERDLFVPLRGSTRASYVLEDDGSLTGTYQRTSTSRQVTGRFLPDTGS